jgi:hypothetical protein
MISMVAFSRLYPLYKHGFNQDLFFSLVELKAYYPAEFVFQNLHLGSNTTGNVERKPYCFLIKTPMYLFT